MARFGRAVGQLEACADLIEESGTPRLRMAIVLLDNLADNFLYHRFRAHVLRSDDHSYSLIPRRRLTKKELDSLEQSFPNKLDFVAAMSSSREDVGNFISTSDLDILRISHRYRNAIYHRDTHNRAVVPVITRLLFGATCRLFPMSYQPRWGTSVSSAAVAGFSSYDVIKQGMLWPHDAASKVADALQRRIGLGVEEAVETLSADLLERCEQLSEMVAYLPDGAMGLEGGLAWTEFWHRFGHDAKLVKLADRADTWLRRDEANPDAVRADASAAQEEYNARVLSLWKNFQATVSLEEIPLGAAVAKELEILDDLPLALHVYYEVDTRLDKLEDLLGDMVEAYDREINRQIDEWRESH